MTTISPEESEVAQLLLAEGAILGELHISANQWTDALEGKLFPVMLGETHCHVWLPESDWQMWCEGMIGSSDQDTIDPLLLSGIAEWGMSPLILSTSAKMLRPMTGPARCSILPDRITLIFSWQIEHYRFRALLFDWPTTYFRAIAGQILPQVRPRRLLPPVAFSCFVGWCEVSINELNRLSLGVGLCMRAFGDLRAGELVLQLTAERVARVCIEMEGQMKINELVEDVESLLIADCDDTHSPPLGLINIDELPQKLLVEVGQVEIAIGVLRTLSEGDLLPAEATFSSEVKLRLNGRVIGQGELVGCDDRFLVRVTRWYLSPVPLPQEWEDTVIT